MFLQYFTQLFLITSECRGVHVEINGEISFDVKISNLNLDQYKSFRQRFVDNSTNVNQEIEINVKNEVTEGTTTPAGAECIYRYPEEKPVNTIIDNMMNELTQLFVRVQEYVRDVNGNRIQARFRVVTKKDTSFFEKILHNMTQEYREFYNTTTKRVIHSGKDPCQHQKEIKQIWKALLNQSFVTFRKAALQCIEEHLKTQNRGTNNMPLKTMEQLLSGALSNVKSAAAAG